MRRVDYGYTVTSFSSQGSTVDRTNNLREVLYWTGYESGCHRVYHNENFSSAELHQWRWALAGGSGPTPMARMSVPRSTNPGRPAAPAA
jgi:hypothetical protein